MKAFVILCLAAATLVAQQQSADTESNPTRGITAASQFFDHDFINAYVFANGIFDTRVPTVSNGVTSIGNGFGWEAGGGLTLSRQFKSGGITLNYRGSYRDLNAGGIQSGNQQSLSLAVQRRLNRHWTLGSSVSGGIMSYGTSFYGGATASAGAVSNPFSAESRFLDAGVTLTYNQTRRLSYVFGGNYFLSNYSFANAINSYGGSGSASVYYRMTARTTIGGTYGHSYFTYSQNTGNTSIDSGTLSISHQFSSHWQLDLSGGINRSHSVGVISIPVQQIFNGQLVTGYLVGPYDRVVNSPAYQGTLSHSFRHQSFALAGGQSVLPGNGFYLSSRSQFSSLTYSYSTRRSNFGLAGTYNRLTSVANSVSRAYATTGASASYGINVMRFVSANLRYDFIHYDGFSLYNGVNEHRISFGLSLSTKSVPLTLY